MVNRKSLDSRFTIYDLRGRKLAGGFDFGAGWSSPVARWAHNPKVAGSNPAPATKLTISEFEFRIADLINPKSQIANPKCFWGCSSVGRAHGLQPWGQGFESPHLHQCFAISDLRFEISNAPKLERSTSQVEATKRFSASSHADRILSVEVSTLRRK